MSDWHAREVEEVCDELDVDLDQGLDPDEAQERLERDGPNRLRQSETRAWWEILLEQFQTIVVYLLCAAAVIAFVTGRLPEGIAVVAVIVVNTAIGFVTEWRAVQSMQALREMGEHETRVRRGGKDIEVDASDVVRGDVVTLEGGELIPADLRLARVDGLRISEAPLTGESVPVDKQTESIPEDTELAERSSMAFKGTSVADGSLVGIVVETGTDTEIGRVSELAAEAESSTTPLQKRLDELGSRLAWITVGIAIFVALIGYFVRRQEAELVIETALALGIAAIPEGLPIVATIALARGMYLMSERNALINRLTAVETLGATRVIFTDKTGTLTENEMRPRRVVTAQGETRLDEDEEPDEVGRRLLEVGLLCNSAGPGEDGGFEGDPTEIAILMAGEQVGMSRQTLIEKWPEKRCVEFDRDTMMMASFHEDSDGIRVAVKGAPSSVLEASSSAVEHDETIELDEDGRTEWNDRIERLAGEGLRLLAMAEKHVDSVEAEPYEDLQFLGLIGILDPPREGVREAIDACQRAGIRVEMVTGDQPDTAAAIGAEVGIVGGAEDPETKIMRGRELASFEDLSEEERDEIYEANIFARVTPEQKLNLVKVYQEQGESVAMTGDGVNDAPALKKADIGVAMGERGTEAARQVADMVLEDDAFSTIVSAVEQGRVIFENIRKSVMFMLCTNGAEILAVASATIAGLTLPLRPLQILYLNVITDVLPALALGVGPGSGKEMDEPPRDPGESVLTRERWMEIAGWAVVIAGCVLAGLLIAENVLGLDERAAVTVSFLTIAFTKCWFPLNLRTPGSGFFVNEITRNPWMWAAVVVSAGLLFAAVYMPGLSHVLKTSHLGLEAWGVVFGLSLVPLALGQLLLAWRGR